MKKNPSIPSDWNVNLVPMHIKLTPEQQSSEYVRKLFEDVYGNMQPPPPPPPKSRDTTNTVVVGMPLETTTPRLSATNTFNIHEKTLDKNYTSGWTVHNESSQYDPIVYYNIKDDTIGIQFEFITVQAGASESETGLLFRQDVVRDIAHTTLANGPLYFQDAVMDDRCIFTKRKDVQLLGRYITQKRNKPIGEEAMTNSIDALYCKALLCLKRLHKHGVVHGNINESTLCVLNNGEDVDVIDFSRSHTRSIWALKNASPHTDIQDLLSTFYHLSNNNQKYSFSTNDNDAVQKHAMMLYNNLCRDTIPQMTQWTVTQNTRKLSQWKIPSEYTRGRLAIAISEWSAYIAECLRFEGEITWSNAYANDDTVVVDLISRSVAVLELATQIVCRMHKNENNVDNTPESPDVFDDLISASAFAATILFPSQFKPYYMCTTTGRDGSTIASPHDMAMRCANILLRTDAELNFHTVYSCIPDVCEHHVNNNLSFKHIVCAPLAGALMCASGDDVAKEYSVDTITAYLLFGNESDIDKKYHQVLHDRMHTAEMILPTIYVQNATPR